MEWKSDNECVVWEARAVKIVLKIGGEDSGGKVNGSRGRRDVVSVLD